MFKADLSCSCDTMSAARGLFGGGGLEGLAGLRGERLGAGGQPEACHQRIFVLRRAGRAAVGGSRSAPHSGLLWRRSGHAHAHLSKSGDFALPALPPQTLGAVVGCVSCKCLSTCAYWLHNSLKQPPCPRFPRAPWRTRCGPAELVAEGPAVLQHMLYYILRFYSKHDRIFTV